MFNIFFADGWIQTADLWTQKRLLYQLRTTAHDLGSKSQYNMRCRKEVIVCVNLALQKNKNQHVTKILLQLK